MEQVVIGKRAEKIFKLIENCRDSMNEDFLVDLTYFFNRDNQYIGVFIDKENNIIGFTISKSFYIEEFTDVIDFYTWLKNYDIEDDDVVFSQSDVREIFSIHEKLFHQN